MDHTTNQRCSLCDRSFPDRKAFGRHLWEEHHMTPNQYRVEVLGTSPKCCNPDCNNAVPRSTSGGWHKACSPFCALKMGVDIPLTMGSSGLPFGLPGSGSSTPRKKPSLAGSPYDMLSSDYPPYSSGAAGNVYRGPDKAELTLFFFGALVMGLIAGAVAALAQWAMAEYFGWTAGSANFYLSIRATTIMAAFLGAAIGAFMVILVDSPSGVGDGVHMTGAMIGCVLGALVGRLSSHFAWAPEWVATLAGFDWAQWAEQLFGAGALTPFWMRVLGGGLSGAAIFLLGFLVGLVGCWGDAARVFPAKLFRLIVAWGLAGFALWRLLVWIG